MVNILDGAAIAIEVAVAAVVLGAVAGVIKTISVRANIASTHWLNKHKGGKAYIILSGHPQAVAAAQEVVVQVLNEVEREQAAAQAADKQGGIGLYDKPTNPPSENTGVPAPNKPAGGKE